MAFPFQQEESLTKEQSEILRELNSFQQVSSSHAWQRIKDRLQADVDEAQEELLGCKPDVTLEQRGLMALRWQQRIAIQRDLLAFVDEALAQRDRLLEDIKEASDEHSTDAGNNDQQ